MAQIKTKIYTILYMYIYFSGLTFIISQLTINIKQIIIIIRLSDQSYMYSLDITLY